MVPWFGAAVRGKACGARIWGCSGTEGVWCMVPGFGAAAGGRVCNARIFGAAVGQMVYGARILVTGGVLCFGDLTACIFKLWLDVLHSYVKTSHLVGVYPPPNYELAVKVSQLTALRSRCGGP